MPKKRKRRRSSILARQQKIVSLDPETAAIAEILKERGVVFSSMVQGILRFMSDTLKIDEQEIERRSELIWKKAREDHAKKGK